MRICVMQRIWRQKVATEAPTSLRFSRIHYNFEAGGTVQNIHEHMMEDLAHQQVRAILLLCWKHSCEHDKNL